MNLFHKKKNKENFDSNTYNFRFEEYGKEPKDFIIFAGMSNPEIAKNEHLWISWDVALNLLGNAKKLNSFSDSLNKATEKYIKEQLEKLL